MLYSLVEPSAEETPVLVEVPHAGLSLDPQSLAYCTAPCRSIGQDADLLVSDLFADAPEGGAHLLYSHVSRYVCDLNRAEDDYDCQTSPSGEAISSPYGVVWRKTTQGGPAIAAPIPSHEIERRLDLIYRPYHNTLQQTLEKKRAKFGFAILLCGHSMPSFGRLGERRADIVPGSRGRTTACREVIETCDQLAHQMRYDVAHDTPYRGGFTTAHYGRPEQHIHALQIEFARRIYMSETELRPQEKGFELCKSFCSTLVKRLGQLKLEK